MFTDKELIDYTIKFSADPEKVRLATIMERTTTGAIWDDLVDCGIDETWCTFRSEWGSDMHTGQYIRHLREELDIRDDQILELTKELEELKARTVADLIQELNQQITTEKYMAQQAREAKYAAERERDVAKDKLSMWRALNGQNA